MKTNLRRFIWILIALIFLVLTGPEMPARAQSGETIFVTSPAANESISGIVAITGAVYFPDFLKYDLFFKTGDQMFWASTVYAPVINGVLARVDTRTFPDGAYQLVVRQVHTDSNYTDFVGPTFYIENNLDAPRPYPEIEPGVLYPPVAGALIRVRNCSGVDLKFDYHSPDSFCSGGSFSVQPKPVESQVCPFVDTLVIPCEYQGTAMGLGVERGGSYNFQAELGKIYELTYSGEDRLYVAEIPGDERAETDIGGLALDDPARLQPVQAVEATESNATESPVPNSGIASTSQADESVATTPSGAETSPAPKTEPSSADAMLPVSGQEPESNTAFLVVAAGLILLLVIGGVIAARRRTSAP